MRLVFCFIINVTLVQLPISGIHAVYEFDISENYVGCISQPWLVTFNF